MTAKKRPILKLTLFAVTMSLGCIALGWNLAQIVIGKGAERAIRENHEAYAEATTATRQSLMLCLAQIPAAVDELQQATQEALSAAESAKAAASTLDNNNG